MARKQDLILVVVLALTAPGGSLAFAGMGHLVLLNGTGPDAFRVDMNPLTTEQLVFNIVVDSSQAPTVGGFEWQLGVSGLGLEFDAATSETTTRAHALDALAAKQYLLYGDSDGFDAALSAKGIRGGDVSASLSGHLAASRSLGMVVVTVSDEVAAQGWHTIQDPLSFLMLTDFESTEDLSIPNFQFQITPEPCTIGLLAVGMLGVLGWRRHR